MTKTMDCGCVTTLDGLIVLTDCGDLGHGDERWRCPACGENCSQIKADPATCTHPNIVYWTNGIVHGESCHRCGYYKQERH